ncbi:MFS transporter [Rhizobium puerariae]|uniref:MFS transporter n=1 Tax=Rhizobium puerariae TaxID=1585791 RepID=A0ABV6AMR4_9HYPH
MTTSTEPLSTQPLDNQVLRRVTWRLMPLLLVCYVFAHLDRVNVGFARTTMMADIGMSNTMYGAGAGLFFIAYMLFGVPSNMLLARFGPRRWIAVIMVLWGLLSVSTLFVSNHYEFYAVRFLLGMAEAGFFPGILIYINSWFPARRRGNVTAMFTLAVPLASVLGAPISGWIIEHTHGWAGFHGWQWMFLLEGAPVVLLGLIVLWRLPNRFTDVSWLTAEEKRRLGAELQREEASKASISFAKFILDPKLLLLFGIYFAVMLVINTLNFWTPGIIADSGVGSETTVGFLTAIPWLLSCFFMVLCGMSADRMNERRWHLVVPLLMATAGFIGTGLFTGSTVMVVLFLSLATMGGATALPMFWQIPPMFLSGRDAVAGIALVSSLGNLAGFLAPYLIGLVKDLTGEPSTGLYILAVLIALGASLVLLIRGRATPASG